MSTSNSQFRNRHTTTQRLITIIVEDAVEFWARQATEVGIPFTVHSPAGKPIFVATVVGSDPSLPSIMLNTHMDVVKVDEVKYKFKAHLHTVIVGC